ncbi:uncharacterized protein [Oscarella lobularis]|uniref:uncharacterized protein n=1 Tax=Oscarella lobularis TaxID=121494 RepID=UPI0033135C9B
MASVLSFVLIALTFATIFSPCESSHFRGFTMNFRSVGNAANGDAGKVQFSFRITWKRSSTGCTDEAIEDQRLLVLGQTLRCLSNNCGSTSLQYVCTSFDAFDDWASGVNTFQVSFPVNDSQEFIIGNLGCCWTETQNTFDGNIQFQSRISFVSRPEGVVNPGEINQSPVASMVPFLTARLGCEYRLMIPNADPDFDDVKCRWALPNVDSEKDECGSACIDRNKRFGLLNSPLFNSTLFNSTLSEEECKIIWIPSKAGFYAAAVQIEDYYSNDVDRTNPLSSIPLQWFMNVVDTGTPCWSRPIFPYQIHIPREHPRCFAAESGVNLTLEILVAHTNSSSHEVSDSAYALPRNMTVTDLIDIGNELKSVTFTWNPDTDQANRMHFMCFQFLDDVRAPSNQVCFTIVVTSLPQPKPILNTQTEAPRVNGQVALGAMASITFDQEVRNPTVGPRFISVYHVTNGTLIQRVDSSNRSLVTIGADSRTISFQLNSFQPKTYQEGEEYEIVFEEGVVVGTNASCSGGGPVAKGIEAGEWTFISAGQPGDECLSGTDNCNDRAQCVHLLNGFRCECNIGYTGDGVSNCDDIDECLFGTDNCHIRATCSNTLGNFTCSCKVGYAGDGVLFCDDVNECVLGTDNCHQNAYCVNTDGSFQCTCESGFTGNGVDCVDVDECAQGADFQCDESVHNCLNTLGGYNCTCKIGYQVDAIITTDSSRPVCFDCNECLPECPEAIDEECHSEATCSNTLGSYDCTCNAGFTPDPASGKPTNRPVCIKPDACTRAPNGSHTCHEKALCRITDDGFDCECMTGYKADGSGAPANRPVCIDCNECLGECPESIVDKGACHVNVDCTNVPGSFNCTCKTGYVPQVGSSIDRPVCIKIDECVKKRFF